ncbi:GNAT family N-acetyltransferase [Amycolatopsis alkalitolerans]|nr:GNAT family N-acetyltransferase [Amycolatopsis alkalitolerans]
MVLVRPSADAIYRRRAEIRKLMVHPGRQRNGAGGRLPARAIEYGRRLGFRQLLLATRGGTGLPELYRQRGWTEVGRCPAARQVAPGHSRDEHWFQLDLDDGGVSRTA